MAGTGFLLQKTVRLDVRTLSKLNVNLLVPCFVFHYFYHLSLDPSEIWKIAVFTWTVMAAVGAVAGLIAWRAGYRRSLTVAFVVSTMFYNSGNYGVSVMELVFGPDSPAVELQALVLTSQNVIGFTVGVFFISSGTRSFKESIRSVFRYPIIPAFVAAFGLRALKFDLPVFIEVPVGRIAPSLVPIGLMTLGAQIALVTKMERIGPLALSSICRLLIGPVIAFGVISFTGLDGLIAQALLISSSVPTAVNTAILSIEFDAESNFASQAVVLSTLASAVTVSATIHVALNYL